MTLACIIKVLVDEFGRVGVVGVNAAYLGCGQIDLRGFFFLEKGAHGGLAGQVQLGMGAGDHVRLALLLQGPHDGRANHASMARHVYFRFGIHCIL